MDYSTCFSMRCTGKGNSTEDHREIGGIRARGLSIVAPEIFNENDKETSHTVVFTSYQ